MIDSVSSFARKATLLATCILLISTVRATADSTNSTGLSARLDIVEQTVCEGQLFRVLLTICADGHEIGDVFELSAAGDDASFFVEGYSEQQGGREVRDGREVDIRRFEYLLRTWATGDLQLSPVLKGQVIMRPAPGNMRAMTRVMMVDIPVEPTSAHILPLPREGRPTDFSGAVGKMTFRAELSTNDATLGDLIRLVSTVSGDADPARIMPPLLPRRPGYKTYTPSLLDVRSRRGVTYFEQIVIPISESLVEIPSLRFVYFDPIVGIYTTAVSGPFEISVGPDESLTPFPTTSQEPGPGPASPPETADALSLAVHWPLLAAMVIAVIAVVFLIVVLRPGSDGRAAASSTPAEATPTDPVIAPTLSEVDALMDRNELIKASDILLELASDCATRCVENGQATVNGYEVSDKLISELRATMERCNQIRTGAASDLSAEDQKLALLALRKILEGLDLKPGSTG